MLNSHGHRTGSDSLGNTVLRFSPSEIFHRIFHPPCKHDFSLRKSIEDVESNTYDWPAIPVQTDEERPTSAMAQGKSVGCTV